MERRYGGGISNMRSASGTNVTRGSLATCRTERANAGGGRSHCDENVQRPSELPGGDDLASAQSRTMAGERIRLIAARSGPWDAFLVIM